MKTLNKVRLVGYICNPEVIEMKNGTQLIKCSLATHESTKTRTGEWETETTFHRIIFWKSPKNTLTIDLKKGMLVEVEGKLVVNQFVDKEGMKRMAILVQASTIRTATDEPLITNVATEIAAPLF